MAAFGAAIDRGGEHRDVFELLGVTEWHAALPAVLRDYGSFREEDLYPDALPALHTLRSGGYRISLAANQPAERAAELEALRVPADLMVMSDAIGIYKPDAAFFTYILALMGDPDPANVAYVGDRIDNDVLPAARAGMRPIWLRRGPWGILSSSAPAEAVLVIDSLTELAERIDEAWSTAPSGG